MNNILRLITMYWFDYKTIRAARGYSEKLKYSLDSLDKLDIDSSKRKYHLRYLLNSLEEGRTQVEQFYERTKFQKKSSEKVLEELYVLEKRIREKINEIY